MSSEIKARTIRLLELELEGRHGEAVLVLAVQRTRLLRSARGLQPQVGHAPHPPAPAHLV